MKFRFENISESGEAVPEKLCGFLGSNLLHISGAHIGLDQFLSDKEPLSAMQCVEAACRGIHLI